MSQTTNLEEEKDESDTQVTLPPNATRLDSMSSLHTSEEEEEFNDTTNTQNTPNIENNLNSSRRESVSMTNDGRMEIEYQSESSSSSSSETNSTGEEGESYHDTISIGSTVAEQPSPSSSNSRMEDEQHQMLHNSEITPIRNVLNNIREVQFNLLVDSRSNNHITQHNEDSDIVDVD